MGQFSRSWTAPVLPRTYDERGHAAARAHDMMSRRWTPDDLCHLRRLAAQGADPRDIAALLGRSVIAVRMKAAHLRIALPGPQVRRGPPAFRFPSDEDPRQR